VEVHLVDLDMELGRYYSLERGQYNATLILAGLLRHLPAEGGKIVGVTQMDLFIPVLTFVFGQAQLDGAGALVSTYRLYNQFYGLPVDEKALIERTVKEIVHEVGHTFGLVHCDHYACVMHAATYVEDVDLKTDRFCSGCRARLLEGQEAAGRAASS
jgi:archaemetzincin